LYTASKVTDAILTGFNRRKSATRQGNHLIEIVGDA